jgi:hypothetical protein
MTNLAARKIPISSEVLRPEGEWQVKSAQGVRCPLCAFF